MTEVLQEGSGCRGWKGGGLGPWGQQCGVLCQE